jgi:hypothetical protein
MDLNMLGAIKKEEIALTKKIRMKLKESGLTSSEIFSWLFRF